MENLDNLNLEVLRPVDADIASLKTPSITINKLARIVAQKTGYTNKACYEVLRVAFDSVGDLLVSGEKISLTKLFSLHLEVGTMFSTLTSSMVTYVRPKLSLSESIKMRAKEGN